MCGWDMFEWEGERKRERERERIVLSAATNILNKSSTLSHILYKMPIYHIKSHIYYIKINKSMPIEHISTFSYTIQNAYTAGF